jgi:hypothetical protein
MRAVAMLSEPAEVQVSYLERLGTAPSADELALELDDILPAVRARLPPDAQSAVLHLHAQVKKLSGPVHHHLWTVDALRQAPEWLEIRRVAQLALGQLRTLG